MKNLTITEMINHYKKVCESTENAAGALGKEVEMVASGTYWRARKAIEHLEELEKYKELGTVEELKKAKDKDKAIIPNIWGDGEYNGQPVYDMYDCPTCEKSYEIVSEKHDYCPNCGQKLDWSEYDAENS